MHVAILALKSATSHYFLKGIKAKRILFGILFPNFSDNHKWKKNVRIQLIRMPARKGVEGTPSS